MMSSLVTPSHSSICCSKVTWCSSFEKSRRSSLMTLVPCPIHSRHVSWQ